MSAPRYSLRQGIIACAGVFLVIAVLAFGTFNLGTALLLGSFGSSAVMVFAFPEIHFAQPRSVIGGHVISAAVGLAALGLFGPTWWALALAAAALALMMLTRTVHPPAGSNPLIVFLVAPQWGFLLLPTLAGTVVIVLVALVYHRVCKKVYPAYW